MKKFKIWFVPTALCVSAGLSQIKTLCLRNKSLEASESDLKSFSHGLMSSRLLQIAACEPQIPKNRGASSAGKFSEADSADLLTAEEQSPSSYDEVVAVLGRQFPSMEIADITRFVTARNGNINTSAEMISTFLKWRDVNLPGRWSVVQPVIDLNCVFVHGEDKEGSPVLYFRWGVFDSNKASYEAYLVAAGHILESVARSSKHQKVTLFVDLEIVPGGTNGYADVQFLKYIMQTASNYFPERLKRMVVYPMPWYGMSVWNCVQYFLDERTREKLVFIPRGEAGQTQLAQYIDSQQIPDICGGRSQKTSNSFRDTFV